MFLILRVTLALAAQTVSASLTTQPAHEQFTAPRAQPHALLIAQPAPVSPIPLPAPVSLIPQHAHSAAQVQDTTKPAGSLIIVGGGSRPASVTNRFIELAGGRGRARVVVIPLASETAEETGRESAAAFTGEGVAARSLVVTRAEANSDTIARVLAGVTGVWFSGGDQVRITAVLAGTRLHHELLALYRRGAVIGGTSAGAAIMSDSMLTGSQYQPGVDTAVYLGDTYTRIARSSIQLVGGLGFLPHTLVDQHFVRRERHNRLLSLVLERPHLIGAGIDEQTAIEVTPAGAWRVVGNSVVVVYDARSAATTPAGDEVLGATGLRMHVIPPGGVFDPRTGTASLREAASR